MRLWSSTVYSTFLSCLYKKLLQAFRLVSFKQQLRIHKQRITYLDPIADDLLITTRILHHTS